MSSHLSISEFSTFDEFLALISKPSPNLSNIDEPVSGLRGATSSHPGINFSASLNDDILLHIFTFNTDMSEQGEAARKGFTNGDDKSLTEKDDDSGYHFFMSLGRQTRFYALTITLRTSQVCQRWRQLLLASTSVWGRLIDLDILSKANILLREEVFRRADSGSRLSVKGFNIPYPSPTCDFVFRLIREHWARLEWVDIYILTKVKLTREQSQFWSTITTPAPNLRHFSFVFSIPVTTNPQILTGNASGLQELSTSPSSPLRLNSPWLRQLTFLSIDGVGEPTLQVTLPELLKALPHMSHLETLRLVYTRVAKGIYTEHRHVQLPSLRKLVLHDDFNTCFTVLRHLAPSSQCTLDIRTENPHDIQREAYWKLIAWLEQYLEQRTYNDRLLIDLQPKQFSFVDAYPDCYPAPTISIHIDCDPQRDDKYALSFFGVIPSGKFEQVKSLWYRINIASLWAGANILNFLPVSDGFYYGLKSLEVLKTTTQGFTLLAMGSSSIDDSDEITVPLPQLQRVRIIDPSDENARYDLDLELGPQFVQEFVNLFKKRKHRGRSIKHLDVRGCMGDLRKLDRCKDLKVTWLAAHHRDANGDPGEYICGSGNRRVLNVEGLL